MRSDSSFHFYIQVVEFPAGYVKMDAGIGSWPKDAFCQVEFGSDGRIASYELKVDLYNFIGRDKANLGHPGVFFNADDEDNYDFVYFRFDWKAFDNLMRTIEI